MIVCNGRYFYYFFCKKLKIDISKFRSHDPSQYKVFLLLFFIYYILIEFFLLIRIDTLITTKLTRAAERLGLPTSPPYLSLASATNKTNSFLTGVSFASGGAGIIDGTAKIFVSFKLFSIFLYI